MSKECYERWEFIVSSLKEGKSVHEISKDLGVVYTTLVSWVNANGAYLSKAMYTLPVLSEYPKGWESFVG